MKAVKVPKPYETNWFSLGFWIDFKLRGPRVRCARTDEPPKGFVFFPQILAVSSDVAAGLDVLEVRLNGKNELACEVPARAFSSSLARYAELTFSWTCQPTEIVFRKNVKGPMLLVGSVIGSLILDRCAIAATALDSRPARE